MQKIVVIKEDSGGRLDKYLLRYLNEAPKSFIYKMLRKKNIKLNEAKAEGSEILRADDVIELFLSDETINKFRRESNFVKTNLPIDIVFEDENVLICNKPAGLLSQPGGGYNSDSLITRINGYYSGFAALCNRLDRNTTGIVVCGKNPLAVREINNAIADKAFSKYYLTLVKGRVDKESRLENFYKKDSGANKGIITSSDGSSIITKYSPVAVNDSYSLLEVELITGKSHQIRLHMQHAGYPIIGDSKYGDLYTNKIFQANAGVKHQLLHSYKIIFNGLTELSYLNGKSFEAAVPEAFERAISYVERSVLSEGNNFSRRIRNKVISADKG